MSTPLSMFSDEEISAGMDELVAMGMVEFRDTPTGRMWRLTQAWVDAIENGEVSVEVDGQMVVLTPEMAARWAFE